MSNDLRPTLRRFIDNPKVQNFIILLILLNALILGLETSPAIMQHSGNTLLFLDKLILLVFVVEIVVRLYVHRLAFWKDPWSIFDFSVVAIALIPASGPLAVLRALRVLRVLRLLTMVPSMRRVVGALLASLPGLGSIAVVLGILYYVFAVIATNLFSTAFPEWFGSIGKSLYTLFQIMTLESWSMGIVRPVMELYPYAWLFFIPFILIATFTMLNLFIAIIVSAMQKFTDSEHLETLSKIDATQDHIENDMHDEMRNLRKEISELKKLMQQQKGI
jgi:voltage-gated sodium channel